MLVRLLPNQITENWEVIGGAIENSLPPIASQNGRMSNVLTSLLNEDMQCWLLTDELNKVPYAIGTTTVYVDACTDSKNLIIYSLYGFKEVTRTLWRSALETITKFAEVNGCHKIIAYTELEGVGALAKALGGVSTYKVVEFNLGG